MNKFSTFEDGLLEKYLDKHPGKLFKEVKVGKLEDRKCSQRVDAILIPNKKKEVYCEKEIDLKKIKKELEEKSIEIIEVKAKLNRAVIGQVEVAKYLADNNFNYKKATPVIICSKIQAGLKQYCNKKNIKVVVFPGARKNLEKLSSKNNNVNLLLNSSQNLFHTQDLALLWDIQNKNTLYTTIKRYVKRGILFRVYKGFYSKIPIEKVDPIKLGKKSLHSFCYLSTESILTREGIISQSIPYITLISSKSKKFKIKGNTYLSRQMKDEFLFNEFGVEKKNNIKQATIERAVADLLYYNPNYHFDGPSLINWEKVKEIQKKVGFKN